MTEAEAIMLLMDAFPGVKVESCLAGTQHEVMVLAIRRQNERRGPETPIGGGAVEQIPCRSRALQFGHGAQADRDPAQHEAPPAQDADEPFNLWSEAV